MGSFPKTDLGVKLVAGNYINPHDVLSKMDDFLATARADQARPIQQSPDKASQNEHLEAKTDVQKPPRLCRDMARRRPDARQTKQAKSQTEANREQTGRA